MRTLIAADAGEAVAAAAALVADAIRDEPGSVVALPTGRTMVPLYAGLGERRERGDCDFSRVRAFNLDELLLPGRPELTFRAYMERHAGALGLEPSRWEIPAFDAVDPAAECARYDAAIAAAGGFDLAILGVGADGHVAYNLPGAPVAATHVVTLPDAVADSLELPADSRPLRAITVGLGALLRARRVIVLATTAEKSAAVRRLVDGPIDEDWPCSLFLDHPEIDVVLTLAAASEEVR